MKEIVIGLIAFGAFVMIMGVILALGAYSHSNVVIQWIHHPFATGVFAVGLISAFLGGLGWLDVSNNRS